MNKKKNENKEEIILEVKVVQSGDIIKIPLDDSIINKTFKTIYLSLLKELKLKEKDSFISTNSGKMLSKLDFNLTVKNVLEKFGNSLKLYYEKIL